MHPDEKPAVNMIDLTATPEIGFGRDRTKKAAWTGDTIEGETLVFELSVSHDRDRKRYGAYVTRVLRSTDNGFAVSKYQPFRDIQRLPSIPCDRYSAKGLDAAFAESLSILRRESGAPEITRLLVREEV